MKTANHQTSFENRIIGGITIKAACWLLGGLCSILVAVISTYAGIGAKIDKNQETIEHIKRNKELTDVQIKTIEVQLQTIEIRLVRLETQLSITKNNN